MNTRRNRIPGAMWYWRAARAAHQHAAAAHAVAVADHHQGIETDFGPASAGLPAYGTTAELSGGATAPARLPSTEATR